MSVRASVLWIYCLIIATCSCQQATEQKSARTVTRPNIIFIFADDLGYNDLSCYGQTHFSTPNIDALAEQGLRFTSFYTASPVCAPARCGLMTGRDMGHALIRGNQQVPNRRGQLPLPDSAVTVAEKLKEAGYATGMIGKWGLGNAVNSGNPLKQGFDSYFGYLDQILAHNAFPEFVISNDDTIYLDNEVTYLSDTLWHEGLGSRSTKKVDYVQDLFTQEATSFISQHQDNPFFLYLPVIIPHSNGEALENEKNEAPSLEKFADKPWNQEQKAYAAMIDELDQAVGTIVSLVDSLGLGENTLIVFTSDNGPDTYEPIQMFNSNGPWRGHKRDLYEGGIRMPLVARWTGTIESGRTSDHPSALWDFMPTFCEMAGVETPPNNGISILPELRGEAQPEHDYLYFEFPIPYFWQAVRMDQWKAVKKPDESDAYQVELYDLRADPGEETNVASEHPAIAAQLDSIMMNHRTPNPNFPSPFDQP